MSYSKLNPFIISAAISNFEKLLQDFLNKIKQYDSNASLQIESLLQKGMQIRYNKYSVNNIMSEYNNLTIDVNGTHRNVSYEIQIYLLFVGWNVMNNYFSKHKYNPIIHNDCMNTLNVTKITFLDIVTQFLDESVCANFF